MQNSLPNEVADSHLDIFSQFEQEWVLREQVHNGLRDANAAFAAQLTQPDGCTYIQACDVLAAYLNVDTIWDYDLQKTVVQVLQVACAMHEIAVNNPVLTPTQRSFHYLATTPLARLCKLALESIITEPHLWYQAYDVTLRVGQAHAKAISELDHSRCLNFANLPRGPRNVSTNGANQTTVVPLPAPATESLAALPLPLPQSEQSGHVHDVTGDAPKPKEKMLPPSLGRHHTMPALQPASSGPQSPAARRPSKRSRPSGHGLDAVQEE